MTSFSAPESSADVLRFTRNECSEMSMRLRIRFGLGEAGALDLFEDSCFRRFPAIRRGLEVVMSRMDIDRGDQLCDAGQTALARPIVGQSIVEDREKGDGFVSDLIARITRGI